MSYYPPSPPPRWLSPSHQDTQTLPTFALSGIWVCTDSVMVNIKCSYCASINNGTIYDNCHSCGAPLYVPKAL